GTGTGDSFSLVLLALVVSIGGLVGLTMAVRRRRRPQELGAAGGATAVATLAIGVDLPPTGLLERTALAPVVDPAEADMPRWRRPSVKAGRVAGTGVVETTRRRLPLLFAPPPTTDVERYQVSYDGVVLLTEPDAVEGRRIQELDARDEVDVLSRGDEWAQVR